MSRLMYNERSLLHFQGHLPSPIPDPAVQLFTEHIALPHPQTNNINESSDFFFSRHSNCERFLKPAVARHPSHNATQLHCVLFLFVATDFQVFLARFCHELREVLLLRLGNGFWLCVLGDATDRERVHDKGRAKSWIRSNAR
jgi:hypothetical protein